MAENYVQMKLENLGLNISTPVKCSDHSIEFILNRAGERKIDLASSEEKPKNCMEGARTKQDKLKFVHSNCTSCLRKRKIFKKKTGKCVQCMSNNTSLCERYLTQLPVLRYALHLANKCSESKYYCIDCGASFTTRKSLEKHIQNTLKCPVCHKYKKNWDMDKHKLNCGYTPPPHLSSE